MGGRGSGGGNRKQGRRKHLQGPLPSWLVQRLFASPKRIARGGAKGALYTQATLKCLAPVTFAHFAARLEAQGEEHAAAAAAFCTLLLLYLLARFGDSTSVVPWGVVAGEGVHAEGEAQPLVAECLEVLNSELPWRFPAPAPLGGHPVLHGLAGQRATPTRVSQALCLHGFATGDDPFTSRAAALRNQMGARGIDVNSQLRTMCLLGRLRDTAVVEWMLQERWACTGAVALAVFIQHAPSEKPPTSLEISLLGKSTRSAAVAVPLWNELLEADTCWTKCVQRAPSYREAVSVTVKKFSGVSGYVAKNIINTIYDSDELSTHANLLTTRDRATAAPVVGPGPKKSIGWLTARAVRDDAACAAFIHSLTPVLGNVLQLIKRESNHLWQGEYSSNNVQLHACNAHRWLSRLRLRVGPKWTACRRAVRPPRRLTQKGGL